MPQPSPAIKVPFGLHWQSRFFAATAAFWQRLGNLESRILRRDIEALPISRPIYVTSLARAGTTITTEVLASHPDTSSHRYSDFPNFWTPYWRNWLLQRSRPMQAPLVERAHGDRIMVNNDSPEAVEELLWRHFFPEQHDNGSCNALDPDRRNEVFDAYYQDHIRKLLLVRDAKRYLAKGNYNVARIPYLLQLFPQARFLIPVRHPLNHIASLNKQHAIFTAAHRNNPQVGKQLSLAGHWEFGPYRNCVNFADAEACQQVLQAWSKGDEVAGWAYYWRDTYEYLYRLNNELENIIIFKYEDICQQSESTIDLLLDHCELDREIFESNKKSYTELLSLPDYYQPEFSSAELKTIEEICQPTAAKLGYRL